MTRSYSKRARKLRRLQNRISRRNAHQNQAVDDDVLNDYSDLEHQELEFVAGNREVFDHLITLFLLTEPGLDEVWGQQVAVNSAMKERSACLESEDYYTSERLAHLVDLALKEHLPYGFHYEYNDNGWGSRSSYDLLPHKLIYNVDEIIHWASPREYMNARHQLSEWLIGHGESPHNYGLASWEKIV